MLSAIQYRNSQAAVSGSSFYAAMRVLPSQQRRAMFAIYAFCRAVDDVADGHGERHARLAELAQWRCDVDALYRGEAPSRMRELAGPVRAFDLQREDFLSVIDGMEMDARADIRAPALATVELYCDRVACAVGRLSVPVFGIRGQDGASLAFHLGRGLQLTNILRDLDEDAAKGRLYLPGEALRAAGIGETDPATVLAHPGLSKVCAAVVDRARGQFAAAHRVMAKHSLRRVRAPRLMAIAYENILERLAARGWTAPRRPIRAGRVRLLWIVLRHGLIDVNLRREI